MAFRILLGALVVLLAAISPKGVALAQGDPQTIQENEAKAREAFSRGRIHYDNGEFLRAAEAFEEAFALSGRDLLQYNLYLAYRDANLAEKAAAALRHFLDRVEVIDNRAQLEARLRALEAGIAKNQAAKDEGPQPQAAPAPTPPPTPSEAEPPANPNWWVLPTVVAGVGVAMMVGSLGTGLAAASKQKTLDDNCVDGVCDPKYKKTRDQGQLLSITTDVLLFGGIAAAATGGVLLFLRKPKRAETRATAFCFADGCAASMTLSF